MNDFRIEVFLSVARNLSFTKASKELFISQPAISKHISELESSYGIQLFERSNNRVRLTPEAKIFKKYAAEIHQKYRQMEQHINELSHRGRGKLTIGASTTIAQYVLPEIIAGYKGRHPELEISLIMGNSDYIEALLADEVVDMAIVEGGSRKREFNYSLFAKDELVVICSPGSTTREEITIEELKSLPLVVREQGSGTLEVIMQSLKRYGVKPSQLNIVMRLGGTEAIKRYVVASGCFAIVSISALVQELGRGELTVVELKEARVMRDFSFITRSGSRDLLVDGFIQYAKDSYNQKL